MATLQRASRLLVSKSTFAARSLATSSQKLAAHDDPLLHVGPWPKTKEERERAARKYNLIPEDYEPYDEMEARGDYPKLPEVGQFNRDHYEDLDDRTDMRNHGEPLQLNYDLLQYHRIDPFDHLRPDNPVWFKYVCFFLIGSIGFIACSIDEYFNLHINHPWKQRRVTQEQQLYEFPPGTTRPHHH